ncbi:MULTISPECIES: trimeric intracellular cation channel family protein [unclassified Actinomyces]|uniref:trimeric intracellular cation channel family protein n=1 Tax=unclassified Actinomyces TaxID=2609248 RepID=UPI0037BE61CD
MLCAVASCLPAVVDLPVPDALPSTFRAVDLCGVLLNGILGGLIARRKNFDMVGFVVLAMLTATAGGILRDVMIQAGPPYALTDPYYLYTACAGALIAWWLPFRSRPARRFLVVADAVVLGTWAATGASKALANGLGVMPALLLGCLTAVGGSMIRDVSVGETPAVFGGNKLYAVPALCSAATEVSLVLSGVPDAYAMLASTLVGAGTCLLAYWRSWRLPVMEEVERERERRRRTRLTSGARRLRVPGTAVADSGGTSASGWRRALMLRPRWAATAEAAEAARPGRTVRPGWRYRPLDPEDR